MKKTILVNGGAGYIGSHAVRQLLDHDFNVVVVDNLSTGHIKAVDPRAKIYLGDMRDLNFLASVFKDNKIDGVMQFAARIIVPESVSDPSSYYSDNIEGVNCVIRCMHAFGVKNIVFSSTAAVYGTKKDPIITEDASLNPESPYGYSKLAVEHLLSYAEKAYGIRHVIFRYFNVAGASLDSKIGEAHPVESHIIPVTVKAGLSGKEMTLFGNDYETRDKTCLRDYIHVVDLAEAHILGMEYLLKGNESNVFNLGSENGYTNLEIINTVSKILKEKGLSDGVPFKFGPRRAGDPAAIVASNQKAKSILQWSPKYSLYEMIESDINWRIKNNALYDDLNKPLEFTNSDLEHIEETVPLTNQELIDLGIYSKIEHDETLRMKEINDLLKNRK